MIIEIDGETHDRERDLRLDAVLQDRLGFVTLRFTNSEVMQRRDDVLRAVLLALEACGDRWVAAVMPSEEEEGRHHPLAPSSEEEGE